MSPLLDEFLAVMDTPGTDQNKRRRLSDTIHKLISAEPDPFWSSHMSQLLQRIFAMFDEEASSDVRSYEARKSDVMSRLQGLHMHIDSLRPRRYE